jgi:hypothetical protein
MRSPVAAFLWHEWRVSWLAIVSASAASVLTMLFFRDHEGDSEIAAAVTVMILLAFAIISVLCRSGGRESQTMPRYFLTLPMRSSTWATLHFAYGVGVLALLTAGLAALHRHLLGLGPESAFVLGLSPWIPILGMAAFGALLEGVFLLTGNARSPILTFTAMGVTVALFAMASGYAALIDAREASRHAARNSQGRLEYRQGFVVPPGAPAVAGARPGIAGPQQPPSQPPPELSREEQMAREQAAARAEAGEMPRLEQQRQLNAMQGFGKPPQAKHPERTTRPRLAWVWIATLVLGYVLSCIGTDLCRHGKVNVGWRKGLFGIPFPLHGSDSPFPSREAAVLWFEWKRFGRYLPWVACTCALYCTPVYLHGGTSDIGGVYAGFLIFSAAGLGTYMTLRHHWDHTTGFNAFVFTLPVSTRTLALARIGMSARSVLISLLVVGIAILIVTGDWFFQKLTPYDAFFGAVCVFAGLLSVLWLVVPMFYAAMGVFLMAIILQTALKLKSAEMDAATLAIIAAVMAIASLWMTWRAYRTGSLLNVGWLGMLTLSSAAACTFYAFHRDEFQRPYELPLVSCLTAALVLFSTVPFASVPLSIKWYRHR